jgi:hypothetical protein
MSKPQDFSLNPVIDESLMERSIGVGKVFVTRRMKFTLMFGECQFVVIEYWNRLEK